MANQPKSPAPQGAPGPARLQTQGSPGKGSSGMGGGKAGNGHPAGGNGKPVLPRDAAGSIFTAQAPAGAGRTVSAVLGEIVWLLTQSPQHKQAFFIGDLEWMAMPPILLQQFRMFYAKDKPIGVILWAFVNDEVEQRLLSGNARMRPQDWKCGDKLWIASAGAVWQHRRDAQGRREWLSTPTTTPLSVSPFLNAKDRVIGTEDPTVYVIWRAHPRRLSGFVLH
jgi:cytolysin-activating lysine-acyltransferase